MLVNVVFDPIRKQSRDDREVVRECVMYVVQRDGLWGKDSADEFYSIAHASSSRSWVGINWRLLAKGSLHLVVDSIVSRILLPGVQELHRT